MDPRLRLPEPEPAWIERLGRGDPEAFSELVRRYERPLYAFLLHRLRDRAAAEDVFSEVFVRVLKNVSRWRPTGRFSAWLFTIAHRLAADWSEKEARRRGESLEDDADDGSLRERFAAPEPGPERAAASGEARERIAAAIAALPAEQREVFLLREYAGLSFAEIADAMDCPLNTALGRMRYAILRLKKELEGLDA